MKMRNAKSFCCRLWTTLRPMLWKRRPSGGRSEALMARTRHYEIIDIDDGENSAEIETSVADIVTAADATILLRRVFAVAIGASAVIPGLGLFVAVTISD